MFVYVGGFLRACNPNLYKTRKPVLEDSDMKSRKICLHMINTIDILPIADSETEFWNSKWSIISVEKGNKINLEQDLKSCRNQAVSE